MPRPIYAKIDLPALVHNYCINQKKASPAKVFAVLKNNAYGHGIEAVGMALRAHADAFAVLDLNEAIALRDIGCAQDILLLGGLFESVDLWIAQQYRLDFTVTTVEQLQMLESQADGLLKNLSSPLFCTVKVRSTMNRLGVAVEDAVQVWQRLAALPNLSPNCWMTHFANADQSSSHIELEQTITRMKTLQQRYPAPLCMANSAAVLQHASTHADAVRTGISLYGSSPIEHYDANHWGLQAVMTLNSSIIAIHTVAKGEAVGYGSRFVAADGPRCIAVVACGYGDGYPRHACDGTPVWINGQMYPLAGRVSMDSLTVDVSNTQQLTIGTPVELWGKNLSIDEVAKHSKTISYQIFSNLSIRVPRLFVH